MNGLRRNLRAISADGAAASAMSGLAENYMPAFVLALTGSALACGLAATVPMVVGGLIQLAAPWLLAKAGSYRRWVVLCAVLQSLFFLPLLVGAIVGRMPIVAAYAAISLYWATGMAGGPAWNNWATTLIPARIRSAYMGRRTRLAQLGLLAGFVLGGVTLQFGATLNYLLPAFALVFLGAAAARTISCFCLSKQSEPVAPAAESLAWNPRSLWQCLTVDGSARLLVYLVAVQAAVQISGPYFTPYMLRELQLSYAQYVVLLSAAYIAKVAFLPWFGRLAKHGGPQRLLWIGGMAIVPCSTFWIFTDDFFTLILIQAFSGMAWAAYELAMALMFFGAIPASRRVPLLTLYNLAYAVATLVGSLVGGYLLSHLQQSREAYFLLFVVSSVGRVAALLLLAQLPRVSASKPAAVPRPALAFSAAMQLAGRRVAAELLDHLPGRRFDRVLPPPVAQMRVLSVTIGKQDAAGVVHDRAEPLLVEAGGNVPGGAPLAAVAGHEEPGVGHLLPELGQLLGVSRADDRPGDPVPALAGRLSGDLLDVSPDVLVDRPAVRPQILDHAAARVRRFDQHEDSRLTLHRHVDEGLKAVSS